MRKYRSWLMGLGIGLIIGASMLQLILVAKDQTVMVAEQTITREQLDEEAKKSGLVLLTADQLDARVNEAVTAALEEEIKEDSDVEAPEIDDTMGALKPPPQATNDAENSASPSETAEPSKSDAGSKVNGEVTLYIPYKMNLSEVADKLQELGVIKDADDFVVKAWSISKKLSVGTAVFNKNQAYQQIMNELIRVKAD